MIFNPGDKVLWHFETTRGWGADYWVSAEVVKINPKRIRIKAKNKQGEYEEINVRPDKLKPYAAKAAARLLPLDWQALEKEFPQHG